MAYIDTNSTPQQDVAAVITETGDNAKTALMWMAVIVVIVLVIVYGSKK
jgi:hypothetical protein